MSAPETVSRFLSELEALSTFQRTNRPLAGRIATAVQSDGGRFASAEIFDGFVDAAAYGHTKVVELFLKYNDNLVDVVNEYQNTALVCASSNNHAKIVACLIAARANVNKTGSNGRSPLFCAASGDHQAVIMQLISANANVDQADVYRFTPLSWAARSGNTTAIAHLLGANANIDSVDSSGGTPLFWAAFNGHGRVTKQLIAANADVNKANNNQKTPLHIAAHYGEHIIVGQLLAAGARLDTMDSRGISPLHAAVQRRSVPVVMQLIAAGARFTPKIVTAGVGVRYIGPIVEKCAAWQHLLDTALTLRPLNLPVLVVYTIYMSQNMYVGHRAKQYRAWGLLKKIRWLCNGSDGIATF